MLARKIFGVAVMIASAGGFMVTGNYWFVLPFLIGAAIGEGDGPKAT